MGHVRFFMSTRSSPPLNCVPGAESANIRVACLYNSRHPGRTYCASFTARYTDQITGRGFDLPVQYILGFRYDLPQETKFPRHVGSQIQFGNQIVLCLRL